MTTHKNFCRYAYAILKNSQEAEDTVQQAYLNVWQTEKEIDFAKSKPLIFKTIRNLSLNIIRHNKIVRKHQQSVTWHQLMDLMASEESDVKVEQLEKAIKKLSKKDQLLIKYHLDNLTQKEMAEKLDCSAVTVYRQLSAARTQLKTLMQVEI